MPGFSRQLPISGNGGVSLGNYPMDAIPEVQPINEVRRGGFVIGV
jgi:hypothetical protein